MARYWDGISVSDEASSVFCSCVLGLKPSSFPPGLSAGWGCSVWTWDKRLDRRGSTLPLPCELKRFCSGGVCGGANQTHWNVSFYPPSPLACSRSPSLLHFLLLLLTHPSLPLSEWVALGLLRLVEVYQKHVCRVGGGRWEVLRWAAHPPPPPHPKLVGKKSSQWVLRRKLIGFLQDILFHWMYKQEKTSHPKPFCLKYTSLENCIILPSFKVFAQAGLLDPPDICLFFKSCAFDFTKSHPRVSTRHL